jgi:hypothetical protein
MVVAVGYILGVLGVYGFGMTSWAGLDVCTCRDEYTGCTGVGCRGYIGSAMEARI